MRKLWNWFLYPPVGGPAAIWLVRLMTGGVFLWEGILKYVYPNQGVGRFTKLGIPFPIFSANFVACLEIVGGACIIFGLATRIFSVLFIIEMAVAMLSTKIGIYLGTSPLPLPPSPPTVGFWAVLHEIRSEYAQMLTSIFFCIVGPGIMSLDARLRRGRTKKKTSEVRAQPRYEEPPEQHPTI